MERRRALGAAVLGAALCLPSCREEPAKKPPPARASARPPIDRLAPNELAESDREVFGFPVPRQMRVEQRFADVAYLIGEVTPEALANYVRQRVEVSHVEIGAARTVFPKARIKAGAQDRVYQLEVIPDRLATKLVIRDVTPLTPVKGLSEEERWRRAGMTPDGRPIDPKKLE